MVRHKKFDRRRFCDIVAGYISENLFDIIQQGTLEFQRSKTPLSYKVSSRDAASFPYINLRHRHLWEQVLQSWQAWEELDLLDVQPNQVPVIVNSTVLRQHISPNLLQYLSTLKEQRQTLRDIATKLNQPLTLTSLAVSIVPHIRNNLIRMVELEDLIAGKVATSGTLYSGQTAANANSPASNHSKLSGNGALVLYIDDSPTDSQKMANIVEGAGYRYINIADPLQALPKLLEVKPQIIFLDLVMPIANGYELCAQIRRISAFKDTPVIIVTNNDGIADRVRAKVVGASGFMGKPISQQKVLKILKKCTFGHTKAYTAIKQPLNLAVSAS
ncbi:MAG: response regulator [Cyanobacteria bacterium P01_D01_bin.156]